MTIDTALGLLLTLASACLINWGYLAEHRAASSLPPLSPRHPVGSLRLLLGNRTWLAGFAAESAGFVLYVAALALAPLALVQSVAAGGIGVLALLVTRVSRVPLTPRERAGVALAIAGLALLGLSLAGGSSEGAAPSTPAVAAWLGASVALAGAAIVSGGRRIPAGAAFGLAAGTLFAAGDVSTKVAVGEGAHPAIVPVLLAFYAAGTSVLQMGFQRGRALTTAGIATLATNAIPIVAAMTIFAEPLPSGALGVLRVAAFGAVVAGAFALAPTRGRSAAPPGQADEPAPPGKEAAGQTAAASGRPPAGR
jgi:hypothetical protein